MSDSAPSDHDLLGYLDEMLPAERMAAIERALRDSESLRRRAATLSRRRDDGVHSVGEIWRRLRLSCPSRSDLGGFLLGTLDDGPAEYIDFHLRTVGCRYCLANLGDLEDAQRSQSDASPRRRRFFESSAGYLDRGGSELTRLRDPARSGRAL